MSKSGVSPRQLLRPFVGVSLLLLLIYFAGPSKIVASWRGFDGQWLLLAAFSITLSTLLGGFNLYLIINKNLGIGFKKFLPGYWVAWAVGLVVPGQIGDIVGLTVWFQRRGIRWEATSGIAIIDKLITLAWMLGLALCGFWLLYPEINIDHNQYLTAGFLALCVTIFCLLLGKKLRLPMLNVIKRFTLEFKNSYTRATRQIALNALLTPLKISMIAAAYWAVFKAAGVNSLPLNTTILLVAAASLIAYIPISFNGIGTVEFTAIAIFGIFDITPDLVLSVFIALRLLVFLLAWGPGSCFLVFAPKTTN